MPAAWPATADLYEFLRAAGITTATPPDGDASRLDYAGAITSAVSELEQRTGHYPFKAETVAVTLYYSPDGTRLVDLGTGWVTISAVRTGVVTGSAGTLLTVGTDYWTRPVNAIARGVPMTYLEFGAAQTGVPNSISVAGLRGYASAIPQAAFDAVLARAAWRVYPALAAGLTGGGVLSERQAGDEREKFAAAGGDAASPVRAAWQGQFEDAVRAYRRVRIA